MQVANALEKALIDLDAAFQHLAVCVQHAAVAFDELSRRTARAEVGSHLAIYNPKAAGGILALKTVLGVASVAAAHLVPPPYTLVSGPTIYAASQVLDTLATQAAASRTSEDERTRAEALLRARQRDRSTAETTVTGALGKALPGMGFFDVTAAQTGGTLRLLVEGGVVTGLSPAAQEFFAQVPIIGAVVTGLTLANAYYAFARDVHEGVSREITPTEIDALLDAFAKIQEVFAEYDPTQVSLVDNDDGTFSFQTPAGGGSFPVTAMSRQELPGLLRPAFPAAGDHP